jgi:plastocyanin
VYPVTLPSQIVADKSEENIYFVQHGGNRISKIDTKPGIYDYVCTVHPWMVGSIEVT